MKLARSLLIVSCLIAPCSADIVPLPDATHATSENGRLIARLRTEDRDRPAEAAKQISLYRYDSIADAYRIEKTYELGKFGPAEQLRLTNDGKLIALNTGRWKGEDSLGLRLYASDGQLLKRWPLSELITPAALEHLPQTGSQTLWIEHVLIEQDRLIIRGPQRPSPEIIEFLKRNGRVYEAPPRFEVVIDLTTLKHTARPLE